MVYLGGWIRPHERWCWFAIAKPYASWKTATMNPRISWFNSPAVHRICNVLVPNVEAIVVQCRPGDNAGKSECFADVARRVQLEGGSVQHGWKIHLWPAVLIEGEFHAIWRSPEETLVDISTPGSEGNPILFLPDPNRVYQGNQISNLRLKLGAHPSIEDFIAIANSVFEETNKGDLARTSGPITLTGDAATLVVKLRRQHVALRELSRQAMASHSGRNDPCPCGSELKYKRCHGG